jgi:RNA polymerase sigma factor (sigma-70 family)
MPRTPIGTVPSRRRRPAWLLRRLGDARLVELVRAGDDGAYEALADRHLPVLLSFSRHMLGSREEAEDAVRHTMAEFRDLARAGKPIDVRPCLFTIAWKRCLSILRARIAVAPEPAPPPSLDRLAVAVERHEEARVLLAGLARLPDDQRAALLLAELAAFDQADIAAVLGRPPHEAKTLLYQARTALTEASTRTNTSAA